MLIKPIGGSGVVTKEGDGYNLPDILLDDASGNQTALLINYETNKVAGNDTGLIINQTDTLSPGASWLIDLQVGGVSKFNVGNDGSIALSGDIVCTGNNPAFRFAHNIGNQRMQFSAGVKSGTGSVSAFTFSRIDNSSSGTSHHVVLNPVYTQTGNAATTDLLINRTENSVGSGAQLLIDLQVDTNSKFNVANDGVVDFAGSSYVASIPTAAGHFVVKIGGVQYKVPCTAV